jgi:hypothetical protein
MDIPSILHNNDGHIRVQILRPASDQRPKGNFKGLLAEYKLWMRQHEDKGLYAFLSSCQKSGRSEEASWEIRQLIRRMGQGESSDPEDSLALKWHLILHLARESEENRIQAEQMLMELKSKKSPLAEALEEDTASSGIFNDLPVFGSQPLMDKHLIRPVLEAWIGLFGSYIPDEGIFITLNKDIIDYISERKFSTSDPEKTEKDFMVDALIMYIFPQLEGMDSDMQVEIWKNIFTPILHESRKYQPLKDRFIEVFDLSEVDLEILEDEDEED